MSNPTIPGLSSLVFESIPAPPPTLAAMQPESLGKATEAKLRASLELRTAAVQSLVARLHVHAGLPSLDGLPAAVRREIVQNEAAAWALLCRLQLVVGAHDAACDAGRMLLERFSDVQGLYQIFATRLVKALLVAVDDEALIEEVEQALPALHDRERDDIARLLLLQTGVVKARNQELPAALSILRGLTEPDDTKDTAGMAAWFTRARIYRTQQLAWEELQCSLRWRAALQESEGLSVAAHAGRLAEGGTCEDVVVDAGLRLISLLHSADRHDEANEIIGEFEAAGFTARASILRSQERRADGWSLKVVGDNGRQGGTQLRAAVYKMLVAGRNRSACIGFRRGGYEEPVTRPVDPDSDPVEQILADLPAMVSGLGLEVVPQSIIENALSTYRWILLREQERPLSGLILGVLSNGRSVSVTAVRCVAFPTRIEQGRDEAWLGEAVDLARSDFDPPKRRGVMQAVDRVLQRLAPAGTRISMTRI